MSRGKSPNNKKGYARRGVLTSARVVDADTFAELQKELESGRTGSVYHKSLDDMTPKDFEKVMETAKGFNFWREHNKEVFNAGYSIAISDLNIKGIDFSGYELKDIDFMYSNFENCTFQDHEDLGITTCKLHQCKFAKEMNGFIFTGSEFEDCEFSFASENGAMCNNIFRDSRFTAEFNNYEIYENQFIRSNIIRGSVINEANISKCKFADSSFAPTGDYTVEENLFTNCDVEPTSLEKFVRTEFINSTLYCKKPGMRFQTKNDNVFEKSKFKPL